MIDDTTYTQPALFVLEYALAMLWQGWGVQPDLLIGHSVGEVVAACVAGVFSLEDGLKLIAARGQLMGALPRNGAMAVLFTSEERTALAIAASSRDVSIAAVNGPMSVVISGERKSVKEVCEELSAEGIKHRTLTVSHAFHSPLMDPMLDAFRQVAENITYRAPQVPLVSNVTGKLAGDELMTAGYWVRHVRNAVRFADGVRTVQAEGVSLFLEIGPQPVLLGLVEQMEEVNSSSSGLPAGACYLPSLRQNTSDWKQILASLAELYVRDVAIDRESYDRYCHRRKVTLPTYAFQGQRIWPAAKQLAADGSGVQSGPTAWMAGQTVEQLTDLVMDRTDFGLDTRATVAKVLATLEAENHLQQMAAQVAPMLYEVGWERKPMPLTGTPARPCHWFLLAVPDGVPGQLGKELAERLTAAGETVEIVYPDPARQDVGAIALSASVTAYLADAAAGKARPLRGLVHLWAMQDDVAHAPDDAAGLMQSQVRNLGSVVHLVQAVAASDFRASSLLPRLWVVTQGAQEVAGTEPVAVAQTPLWGLGRVVALEHGELWGGLVDVDPTLDPAATAKALVAEVLLPDTECGEQVAYRQGQRYVARLVPAHPSVRTPATAIQSAATYLITGGLGSLGLQTARWLVDQGARHLVLIGRRGIQTATQQAIVDELATRGATVELARIDVGDESAMAQLFQSLATAVAPLRGIIHAAGIARAQPLRMMQWDDLAAVLRPKVVGGWLLHRLSSAFDLDFFLTFSSGAGIWGGKQQAHYAAANHFLDGLAALRRSQGLPGLSIAWGPWAGPRGLPSMASTEGQAMLLAMGVHSFTPEQALAIQAYLLRTDAVQITAANVDWTRLKALYELTRPRRFLANLAVDQAAPKEDIGNVAADLGVVLRTLQSLTPAQQRPHLRDVVQQTVGQVLGMTDLPDRGTGFTELGMDSLMALALRRRLEQELQQTLPTTVAYEYPTVEQGASYLFEQVQDRLGNGSSVPAVSDQKAQPQESASTTPVDGAIGAAGAVPQRKDGWPAQPIAIISMACRFPGADTPEDFWELLRNGSDKVQTISHYRDGCE